MPEAVGVDTIDIGEVRCTILGDGALRYETEWLFSHKPPEAPESGGIDLPYSSMLIETGDRKVLIDTGAGNLAPTTGELPAALRWVGVEQEEIDTVILTHGHVDHIGGVVDGDGRPAFPNALYVMSATEWSYWTDATIDLGAIAVPEAIRALLIEGAGAAPVARATAVGRG